MHLVETTADIIEAGDDIFLFGTFGGLYRITVKDTRPKLGTIELTVVPHGVITNPVTALTVPPSRVFFRVQY